MRILKALLLSLVLLFSSCSNVKDNNVKVILEDGDFRSMKNNITLPKGSDFVFNITLDIDKVIADASYKNYSVEENITSSSRINTITFHHVDYPLVITLDIKEAIKISYEGNDKYKEEYVIKNHERINTSTDYNYFYKEGYLLIGWQNEDEIISLGSRISMNQDVHLHALYMKESDISLFEYEVIDNSRINIKKYLGEEAKVVVPEKIDNKNVISLDKNAFINKEIDELFLPRTLSILKENCFINSYINSFIFFDNLKEVDDNSFNNTVINKIRINAVNAPSYIRSYYGTYLEKFDRLLLLKDQPKIILYSGSSTRFGFDSELIDKTFLNYDVINMGVFAYTASYPQIEIISHFVNDNDVVIISPEFDAIEEQINLKPIFDSAFIAMVESNYDILSLLEFNKYDNFFSSFKEFQTNRSKLNQYSYQDSAYQYDEDGNKTSTPSYNRYGDYIVYRKNNEERKSFGVKRAFYHMNYFSIEYIEHFNNGLELLKKENVKLFYDYSPRMNISISDDSSNESIYELGEYLKKNVNATFLSTIQDSLMDPLYFYGTDNHLSSEGVTIRTRRIINLLINSMNI